MRANAIAVRWAGAAIVAAVALAPGCDAKNAPSAPVELEFRVDGMRRINGAL